GFSIGATGAMLSLTAIGGAFGKFGCGPLGDRIGQRAAVIWTEILTAIFLVLVVSAGYYWMFPVVFFMGAFLNGTSSVLYALVPRLTTKVSLNRGFGFYYTTTLATSGVAPLAVGLLGDSIGLHGTYYVMAGILLATIPLMSLVVPRSG
ncbi:MAG: MFS transporter, partial [Bacillota bacterium]